MFKKTAFLLTLLAVIAIKSKKNSAIPLIGDEAPSFKANTTQGEINFPKDYKGHWVILFSHPADFTPVCTTEFMKFQTMAEEFRRLNAELIGLSVDSVNAHIAWIKTIKEKIEFNGMKNININFPIIDDLKGHIARKYGMLHPNADNTKTVRAVFIISPDGKIRAILYYPLTNGRNMQEIKRLLIALQTTDEFNIATPANWNIGDDVILPPPASCKEIQAGLEEHSDEIKCYDWFICFKKLPEETISQRISLY